MTDRDDHLLAHDLATRAGALLVELRRDLSGQGALTEHLKDAGDRASHDMLVAALADARPDDAVLSEEGGDDLARLDAERVWIVDPLDGTREFGEVPRDDWAVHVALWDRGSVTAGAVALPAMELTLSTAQPVVLPPVPAGGPRLLVSRSRPPALAATLAERLGGRLVPMGSAGAKAMAVVRGEAEIYAHSGGQYEWDNAAPAAVARAAGLHVSRLDGSDMRYNQPDPWSPDVLVCRVEQAERVLALIAEIEP